MNGELGLRVYRVCRELGQTIVVPEAEPAGVGRQGCLETYVSAPGLVRTVLYLLSDMKEESLLRRIAPSGLTAKLIAEEAEKGDIIALKAFDYTAEDAWAGNY